MIDIEELEMEFNAFYGDKENEQTLLARMFPLIEEVKRLREEKKRLHRLFGLAVHHIDALKEIVT